MKNNSLGLKYKKEVFVPPRTPELRIWEFIWELLSICPSYLLREGHQSYLPNVNKSLLGRTMGRFLFYSALKWKPMAPSFNLLWNVNIDPSKEKTECFCGTQGGHLYLYGRSISIAQEAGSLQEHLQIQKRLTFPGQGHNASVPTTQLDLWGMGQVH